MTQPTAPTPFTPTPQPELVDYLEALLDRARAGEVQYLVASAGVVPAGAPTELSVLSFSAIGSRVERWEPAARSAGYATTLEGLEAAVSNIEKGMGPLKSKVIQ